MAMGDEVVRWCGDVRSRGGSVIIRIRTMRKKCPLVLFSPFRDCPSHSLSPATRDEKERERKSHCTNTHRHTRFVPRFLREV